MKRELYPILFFIFFSVSTATSVFSVSYMGANIRDHCVKDKEFEINGVIFKCEKKESK